MLEPLANRTYRHLFFAQIVALIGTGLATVALGLLAYQLAGSDAGAVLGTALSRASRSRQRMVGIAPLVVFLTDIPQRVDSGLWPEFGAQPLYIRQRNLPTQSLAHADCESG